MNHSELKKSAKNLLINHYGFFFMTFLVYFVLYFLGAVTDAVGRIRYGSIIDSPWTVWDSSNTIFSLLYSLILVGIGFICIDSLRNKNTYDHGFSKGFTIFSKAKYFWGTVFIAILQFIWVVFWSLLLIIPGIIKGIAYSQAIYIYRDSVDQGDPIKYRDAVTRSRQLMDGNKWKYFWLSLSFIGWFILVGITAGLAIFWVAPYYHLTMTNFYVELKKTA